MHVVVRPLLAKKRTACLPCPGDSDINLLGNRERVVNLDAEEWRDLVSAYLDAACAAVREMGGHVAKKLGDGLMVLFGYPVAQENDAERAARAALSIQRALAEVNRKNTEAGKPALNARIGIETGSVRINSGKEEENVELGNLSSRSSGFDSHPVEASQPAGSESCMWRWQHRS